MSSHEHFTNKVDVSLDRGRNPLEHPLIKKMHPEARKILAEDAIDPREFKDLYGSENVERDMHIVEKVKSGFTTDESKSAADVFEAIIYQHAELSNWLGPNAETIRVSEYDDLLNHVDLVVEFNEDESRSHLALGIDVTFGSIAMQKKFERIKKEIEKDKLAVIKYFKVHGYRGQREQLPRIVIGVEAEKVVALAGYWERNDKRALGEHVTKDIIMQEIEKQLETFLAYAKSVGADNAIKSYTRALSIIKKTNTPSNGFTQSKARLQQVTDDRVYQGIVKNLKQFQKPSVSH